MQGHSRLVGSSEGEVSHLGGTGDRTSNLGFAFMDTAALAAAGCDCVTHESVGRVAPEVQSDCQIVLYNSWPLIGAHFCLLAKVPL